MVTSTETDTAALDARLAGELFGWTHVEAGSHSYAFCGVALDDSECSPIPAYATTGDGMLMVLEAMRARGYLCWTENDARHWMAEFAKRWPPLGKTKHLTSLPLAVAQAALSAIEEEVPDGHHS